MWEAVRDAIKRNGATVRFIVIIVVLACVAGSRSYLAEISR
jgi:hypothetical protein